MREIKQSTYITIVKLVSSGEFTEFIAIPHNVDIIKCHSMGAYIINAVPALITDTFYITSELVSNVHDNILGICPNVSFTNAVTAKTFRNNNKTINGTYSFKIYQLITGSLLAANLGGSVYINLEFIELENN